jgi:hypothetical protein
VPCCCYCAGSLFAFATQLVPAREEQLSLIQVRSRAPEPPIRKSKPPSGAPAHMACHVVAQLKPSHVTAVGAIAPCIHVMLVLCCLQTERLSALRQKVAEKFDAASPQHQVWSRDVRTVETSH